MTFVDLCKMTVVLLGLMLAPAVLSCGRMDAESESVAVTRCVAHGVPESVCTRCNPNLIPEFQASGDWCAGHGVPESQCSLCHPELMAAGVAPPGPVDPDPHAGHDHGPGESHAADVSPAVGAYPGLSIVYRSNQPSCATDGATITFASAETATRAGIRTQPVLTGDLHNHFEAPAEVVFDQNSTTLVSSSLPVSIVRWLVEAGDRVATGQALAEVESPDMALLQAEYLEAISDARVHQREQERADGLLTRGLIDSASHERSRAEADAARARRVQSESRLHLAGLAVVDLERLRDAGEVSARFRLRAASDGLVLERTAPLGRILEPGSELARIGEPDALWIEGHVRERDAARVSVGQEVEFTADGTALGRTTGTVIWISSFLDPESRTATVRVRPHSRNRSLRAHEFGRLQLPANPSAPTIMVPRDAVQWEGCCNVVFVEDAVDRFHPRKVEIAPGDGGYYRVTAGLAGDERVVVAGSFLLKTELKKSSIGAGCCGLEAS